MAVSWVSWVFCHVRVMMRKAAHRGPCGSTPGSVVSCKGGSHKDACAHWEWRRLGVSLLEGTSKSCPPDN